MAAQAFPVEYPQREQRSRRPRRLMTIAERNRELYEKQMSHRRGPTLEVPFTKHLDNSRLVKSSDRRRVHEMRSFAVVTLMMFMLLGVYVMQHFNAIENGYRVESEKQQVEQLLEENRHLRLAQAELTDPGRIGAVAEQLGMMPPQPGQVVQQDGSVSAQQTPVMAQANEPNLAR